jgi:hypothetical protein
MGPWTRSDGTTQLALPPEEKRMRHFPVQDLAVLFVPLGFIATIPNASAAQEILRLPLKSLTPVPVTTIGDAQSPEGLA